MIYAYYEFRVLLPEKTKSGKDNFSYTCKLCKKLEIKDRFGDDVKVKQEKGNDIHF